MTGTLPVQGQGGGPHQQYPAEFGLTGELTSLQEEGEMEIPNGVTPSPPLWSTVNPNPNRAVGENLGGSGDPEACEGRGHRVALTAESGSAVGVGVNSATTVDQIGSFTPSPFLPLFWYPQPQPHATVALLTPTPPHCSTVNPNPDPDLQLSARDASPGAQGASRLL